MATEISKLFVTISASTKEFITGMKDVQTKLKDIGGKMTAAGTAMTAGFTAPLLAVGVASFKAIQAASDLGETQSKVGVIFGESGKQIETFAATAATALGQSKQQAMDAAATFAIFGKSAGLSGTELVGFSTEFTTLASDLASFNNTSPEAAIEALGAALRGEAEPMRAYGVLMDDASLRAQALKMGIIETTKDALTPQQKVLAAHQLILAQTTSAQGDFQRTSEGLANQQRILQAELTNTTTEFGMALLPIALQAVDIFRNQVVPAIQAVSGWFGTLSPGMQKSTIIIGLLVAAIGPLLIIAGTLTTAIAAISLPVLLVIAGIAALIAIGVLLWQNWDVVKAKAVEIWDKISAFLDTEVGKIVALMAGPIGVGLLIIKNWDLIKQKTVQIWGAIAQAVKGPANTLIGFANAILGAFESMLNGVSRVVNSIPSFTIPDWVPEFGGKSFGLPRMPSFSLPRIPSLDVGTNRVNSDGLAMLHAGEMVMPADVAGGGFRGGSGEVNLYIDGKKVSDIVGRHMVDMIRPKTGSAFG